MSEDFANVSLLDEILESWVDEKPELSFLFFQGGESAVKEANQEHLLGIKGLVIIIVGEILISQHLELMGLRILKEQLMVDFHCLADGLDMSFVEFLLMLILLDGH